MVTTTWFLALQIIANSFFKIYLFLGALGLHCCVGPSLVVANWGLLSSCGARTSHCGNNFSCCGTQALECTGFSSYDTWAQQLRLPGSRVQAQQLWHVNLLSNSMQDLPRPRIKPMSPALVGGFFTTEPLGKPWQTLILATFLTPYLWQAKWRSHTQKSKRESTSIIFRILD